MRRTSYDTYNTYVIRSTTYNNDCNNGEGVFHGEAPGEPLQAGAPRQAGDLPRGTC